jgi:dTDP-glucose pyrophosphorylase
MRTALMVMAAGLGARYGGNKQIDRMGPNGEILMEYSIYDALEAGFDKVVFVIKKDMAETFREMVGDRLAKKVEVCYAFQEYDSLPGGFVTPHGRTKPYGTVHAVLCAGHAIHEPFAVINADDYYGKGAFAAMRSSLCALPAKGHASMVGYRLRNTVSENGYVTRGVCEVDSCGRLEGVKETYKIALFKDGTIRDTENDVNLDPNSLVSMNFWGFTPWIFEAGKTRLDTFLKKLAPDEMKKEYPLPVMVDSLMKSQLLRVDVLSTEASWFGVTYHEDKAFVAGALRELHGTGAYPEKLF